jgi:hypothetical protein
VVVAIISLSYPFIGGKSTGLPLFLQPLNTFMKKAILALGIMASVTIATAQTKSENIVIVTLDGMRWQEVFGGVDTALMNNKKFTRDANGMKEKYGSNNAAASRQKLFPFLWTTVQQQGQLFGNRNAGSLMNVANRYKFSYPGYNEIFTGYPDTSVNSNDKVKNPNENVLEFINKQPMYKGKVAAFSTWDVFPYILNTWRSGVYVNADVDTLKFDTPQFKLLNDLQFLTTRPIGVRPDVITYMAAREYLKTYRPKVLYIAFDETDDFAHGGEYDQYIGAAHAEDAMLADLWKTLQSNPQYKGKTTLLITCDHGRGDKNKEDWQHHGEKIAEAGEIWMAAIGPSIAAKGEIQNGGQLYQKQLASTIASVLGMNFKANHEVAPAITSLSK